LGLNSSRAARVRPISFIERSWCAYVSTSYALHIEMKNPSWRQRIEQLAAN
jgi:hypothetical protein